MFEVKNTDILDFEDDDFDTILAEDISFSGNIQFSKPFMIRGIVSGKINATSDLVIDSGALVKAEIRASQVLVKGIVEGNIDAKKLVHVSSTGKVTGDIISEQVVIDSGAKFSGRCSMPTEA